MKSRNWSKHSLFLDRDGDFTLFIDPTSKAAAYNSIRKYFEKWGCAGSHITDATVCLYEQNCMIPNHVTTWMGGKYPLKEDHGHPCDYNNLLGLYSLEGLYRCFTDYDIDPVQIYIDCMKTAGIRPWIALRMNDAHYLYEDDVTYIKADSFYEELEKGHMIGDSYGYFGRCYDFTYPRIRQILLDLIREFIEKYDVFGISLDFLREVFCFDYKNNPDCHKIMTQFIRDVRATLDEVNPAIKLMIRLPHTPKDSMVYGFDAATWCKEGLVDAIEPCARWECTNSGIPVAEWRKIVGNDVALIPGVETRGLMGTAFVNGKAYPEKRIAAQLQPDEIRAYCAAWNAQGADGLFLANMCYDTERNNKIWKINPQSPEQENRRFIVTYQDIPNGVTPAYHPLPIFIPDNPDLSLSIGAVSENQSVTLRIDYEGDDIPSVSAGQSAIISLKPCEGILLDSDNDEEKVLMTPHTAMCCLLPITTSNQIQLHFNGKGIVHYVELYIQ